MWTILISPTSRLRQTTDPGSDLQIEPTNWFTLAESARLPQFSEPSQKIGDNWLQTAEVFKTSAVLPRIIEQLPFIG